MSYNFSRRSETGVRQKSGDRELAGGEDTEKYEVNAVR